MNLLLIRDYFKSDVTLGKLFVDGVFECETLEDCDRYIETKGIKVDGQTAIPRGIYRVIVDRSNRFSNLASKKAGQPIDVYLPRLLQVPYFDGIRIHPLNSAAESEGCIGVGKSRDGSFIRESQAAFSALFAKLEAAIKRGEKITIEVR